MGALDMECRVESLIAGWRTPIGRVYRSTSVSLLGSRLMWVGLADEGSMSPYVFREDVSRAAVFTSDVCTQFIDCQVYAVYDYPDRCGLYALSVDGTYPSIPAEVRNLARG